MSDQPKARKTFDKDCSDRASELLQQLLLDHPELRSGVVVFDWYGSLNDAESVNNGVWIGAEGPVETPDGAVGTSMQMLRVLAWVLQRVEKVALKMRAELTKVGKGLTDAVESRGGGGDGPPRPAGG